MKFITHHRYKGLGLCGERLNIPYGTELSSSGPAIMMPDGQIVCYWSSENAKRYFACNDDGQGLERGALTYAIAYNGRSEGGVRFTEKEKAILERDWKHFLRQDLDVIMFNEDFFGASPEELQRLADAVNIKVRR